jgi:hypothetical protein
LPTQAKLTVGPVDDIYEQEADRVAEQVMRMPEDTAISGERLAVRKKGETIQLKPGQTPEITPDIDLDRSGGRPLSDSTREYMEPRFGMDFGHVRVHADSDAHQTAEQINARAFTYGHHIWFGRGESENDRGLAAHELTHVVQQSIGLSTPMVQRVVRFSINTPLTINQWTPGTTTRNGMDWNVEYGSFEADADIHAEADDPAEFANWEVGFLETERIEWNRRYWQRPNTDYRGRFLERKLRIPPAPLRDHLNTAVVWTAPGEFASVSTIAAGGTAADVPLTTTDTPSSRMRVSASAQSGDVSDGTNNSYQFRAGINWVLYVSAHNSATDEWRHLELIYRSTQAAVDFRTDPAAGVVVDTDDRTQGQSRRFRWSPAADQPAIGGTLANDYVNDPTNWTLDRVEGWT